MRAVTPRPEISVLMPAYNAERYIRQSIHSVLSQTFEDFELLVVDDGSTDTTPEILASVRDPRLRVLRNATNLGVVGALNHG
ncbi:MAG: glycosyltransferase family 2 protein, partial [Rhodospirillales bacterium]|nr:glycosyltransferase family 2 protein [Rhodospirillales bacterium]